GHGLNPQESGVTGQDSHEKVCCNQLAIPPTALPTVVNVEFVLVPSVVMATMQTTIINASITAYSTAVGPSSRFRNVTMFFNMDHFSPYTARFQSWTWVESSGSRRLRSAVTRDRLVGSAGGRGDGVADGCERGLGVGAQRGDGSDADHDDQGQHHGVLD